MAMKAEDLRREALALSEKDRAGLAAELVSSLEGPVEDQETVVALWNEENTSRTRAVLAGEADLVDWPGARDELIDRLTR